MYMLLGYLYYYIVIIFCAGLGWDGFKCIECVASTFNNGSSLSCMECPMGRLVQFNPILFKSNINKYETNPYFVFDYL